MYTHLAETSRYSQEQKCFQCHRTRARWSGEQIVAGPMQPGDIAERYLEASIGKLAVVEYVRM